jgi:dihydrofolate reductase
MRKLKLQMQTSLDGFVAGPNGEMDWMTLPWTDDLNAYAGGLIRTADAIILGRNLAAGFIPHWSGVAADAHNPEQSSGQWFLQTPKFVLSRTLTENPWPNTHTTLLQGSLPEAINGLQQQPGQDILVYGGVHLVAALLAHNLIDELHLFTNPIALGKGLSIFNQLDKPLRLKPIAHQAFQCGVAVQVFGRA